MNYFDSMSNVINDLSIQSQNIILEQLDDLIKRNILIIEQTQPVLIQDFQTNKVKISQAIKLTVKDIDYIKQLEKENKELKDKLTQLADIVTRK